MTKIKDITDFFETFAPVDTAMDFDNVGLLVGDKNAAVNKVLLALDITAEVVFEAEKLGCELIISHHPVIFSPLKRLCKDSVPYLLAEKNIAALCMHTNLDLSEKFGVNTCLAKAVGVNNPILSEQGECLFLGQLESEMSMQDFVSKAKVALGCEGMRYTDVKKVVKDIAVSSGSGGSNVFAAAQIGADVIITGEIKHHEINAANELGINIVDVGHFKSEDIVILPLLHKLSEQFSEIIFTKSTTYSDKIKFI